MKNKNWVERDVAHCSAWSGFGPGKIATAISMCLQSMVTGARGSCGESALLPAGAARGHASVFVITPPRVTVVDHVQETLLNYPGVTCSHAQVAFFFLKKPKTRVRIS